MIVSKFSDIHLICAYNLNQVLSNCFLDETSFLQICTRLRRLEKYKREKEKY